MKKKLLLIFYGIFIFVHLSFSQDKLPAFGKIDKADLEMKDCDFDPGAEAVVLIDVGELAFTWVDGTGWQSETKYRVRIKILKASAINRAEKKFEYYTKNRRQQIFGINAYSYNLDATGNIIETKLEKSAIFDKIIDKDHSEVSFAIPDVKVGTVFEYKYSIITRSSLHIPEWTFQQRIPVKYSAYNIIVPEYFQFTIQSFARQKLEKKDDDYKGTWYFMHNVPGLKEEPMSSGFKDYFQRMEFQLSKINAPSHYEEIKNTWPKLIDELLEAEYFGDVLKKNIKITDELDEAISKTKSTKEKIRTIYNYVQSHMQWNDEYSYSPDSRLTLKDAWDKKTGSVADINFILIRLLKNADIDAKPIIASTKDHGTINTIYPFINQFNIAMAYVKDGDDMYVMNAADKHNPFNLIPYDVLYTNGLIVDKFDGGLISLNSDKKYINNIYFSTSVNNDGKLLGTASINSIGYARNIREATNNKKFALKEMLENNDGITIKVDSIAIKNEKDELLPYQQDIKFSGNIQQSGDYYFLPCTLFTGIGKNPFVQEERVMDIDFNYPKSYTITGSYMLGDNFVVSDLPKNTKIILPDTSIVLTRMIQQDDNVIAFRFTIEFKSPGYTAGSYAYIKEFFKNLYNILDERIVLKKK